MKHITRLTALLMCLFLVLSSARAEEKLPLQEAHQVQMTQLGEQQPNGSAVYRWTIESVHPAVSDELNGLAKAYAEQLAPGMSPPGKDNTSRLDVNIHHYRTGLTWMSFMVQSRYVLNKETKDVRFTTRTYDMESGERILLRDIFPADSEVWSILQTAVKEQISAYYPDLAPVQEAYDAAITREAIERMDFTLHGMSLMLHLHAADFYPGKEQLIQVTLYYPDIRPYMTEAAQQQTDNLTYYYTAAMTYDDGPNGWVTREMLNTLMESGERATFFLVGNRVKGHAQYVQREHDEGHAIATHSYNHEYANNMTAAQLRSMVDRVNRVHTEVIGIAPSYVRAPGGIWRPYVRAEVGWPMILWSVQGSDWDGPQGRDPTRVMETIVGLVEDGGIILMHDMKQNSVTASELIISKMQEKGFLFLTVDELFAKDGVELQPDTAYWRCQNGVTEDD